MDRIEANMVDGLAAAAAGVSAGNYLGDPRVVDRLVRDFLAFAVSINVELQTGAIGADQAEVKLVDLSKKYATIFLGETPGYVAMPWNSPRRLGIYMRHLGIPHMEDHARPADAFFAAIGTFAIQLAMRADKHEITEQEARQALDVTRTDAVKALLGTREGTQAG
ncbi:hypothetical protein SAMN05216567_1038 [Variovorax sp. OK605]|uniref:hypothetical protein n=1 Tax=Variovorax sp. OK605 TaxID=1855317 RepID=UPI0008E5CC99|nr:hypothetical protein [Variovorax sp. OK605]SFO84750.1 hypothetical protein SAMN05216567_1038 [Variovorax sp. OK605]